MEINLSLAALFEATFGYKSPAFQPDFTPVTGDSAASHTSIGQLGTPYYDYDANGREVFLPVTLSYPDPSSATGVQTDWTLPYCVISLSSRKIIVETPLTERRGTVKELISTEDYIITLRGFLINASGNDFPEADVTTLMKVYENNSAISLRCALTDIFLLRPDRSGSDQVVIRSLRLPEVRGIKNIRAFEIECISDESFNLVEINN